MKIKQILSVLLAVFGGLILLGGAALAVWFIFLDDSTDIGQGQMPHENAEFDDVENAVLVNIHFADEELTAEDTAALDVVERTTDRSDVIAYSIEQMIEGPTEEEQAQGFYSELLLAAESQSTCGGEDFSLEAEDGTFVVWLCRETQNFGEDESDAVTIAQISQTLSQFPDVEETIVLGPQRECFGDRSEENQCHENLPDGISA